MAKTSTSFKTGNNKAKGRPKGSKNRSTKEIRNFIQKIVDNNLSNLETDLAAMNPTNRWTIIDRLTRYFLAALTKNDNDNNNTGEVNIVVTYKDKDKEME